MGELARSLVTVKVAVAGSTGSIGRQTLEVVAASGGRYEIVALAAASNQAVLREQIVAHRPRVVAVVDDAVRATLADEFTAVQFTDNVADVVGDGDADADVVVNAVVGFAGLPVTLETLRRGKRLALANKESLIAAGPIVQPLRATKGAMIVPVDSEHCAVHQCLRASGSPDREIASLQLTASGGPFRGKTRSELANVDVASALAHPTWSMGPKITVDSSTLMNKGLEVIEAHELFGVGYDQIEVIVHPQSIIHSMVGFRDGAVMAHLGAPDMRHPIGYALNWPQRQPLPVAKLDLAALGKLTFRAPDLARYPALRLAQEVMQAGGMAGAVFNAAKEVALDQFIAGQIGFMQMAHLVNATLGRLSADPQLGKVASSLDDVLAIDHLARVTARELAAGLTKTA